MFKVNLLNEYMLNNLLIEILYFCYSFFRIKEKLMYILIIILIPINNIENDNFHTRFPFTVHFILNEWDIHVYDEILQNFNVIHKQLHLKLGVQRSTCHSHRINGIVTTTVRKEKEIERNELNKETFRIIDTYCLDGFSTPKNYLHKHINLQILTFIHVYKRILSFFLSNWYGKKSNCIDMWTYKKNSKYLSCTFRVLYFMCSRGFLPLTKLQ